MTDIPLHVFDMSKYNSSNTIVLTGQRRSAKILLFMDWLYREQSQCKTRCKKRCWIIRDELFDAVQSRK